MWWCGEARLPVKGKGGAESNRLLPLFLMRYGALVQHIHYLSVVANPHWFLCQGLRGASPHPFPSCYKVPRCCFQVNSSSRPTSVTSCFPAYRQSAPSAQGSSGHSWHSGSREQSCGCWKPRHHCNTSSEVVFHTQRCRRALWGLCTYPLCVC